MGTAAWVLLAVVLWQATSTFAAIPTKETKNNDSCGIYLAPSTIPNAGLGVFTTRHLKVGDTVDTPGDVCIPIVDFKWHMGKKKDFFWPLSEYVWNGDAMGMEHESTRKHGIKGFCPGAMDCATNCNIALINVGKSLPKYHTAGLHRKKDPGAGAITPYFNGTTVVEQIVPAGGELFKFYGDHWFTAREETFGMIPLEEDYAEAEALVQKYVGFLPSFARRYVWKLLLSSPLLKVESQRTMNALPSLDDADIVASQGIRALFQPLAIRDLDYLTQHGRCMDAIIAGPSTLPQAGRGAFAKRAFSKDSIITGSPLLIILNRSYLNMYGKKDGKWIRNVDDVVGQQLLLNYCMGHSHSTLLFIPYASGVNYINHNQTRANVKIQWSPHGIISHNDSFFYLTVNEMEGNPGTNLAIDYIALRDIQPGEELFMDYGNEFEDAWNRHLKNWEPPSHSKHYADADTFNARMKDAVVRTEEEQTLDPYPIHLEIRCHAYLRKKSWRKYVMDETFDNLWQSIEDKGWPCFVNSRYEENGEFYYNVRMKYQVKKENGKWRDKFVEREGVPRSAISFLDRPYTTDIHLANAFRHDIRIPDDIFPLKWRNTKGGEHLRI